MSISVSDLFKVGIGPSSSHTVGPMKAAYTFLDSLLCNPNLGISRIKVHLYGSLALTGKGHGTDRAIFLGLLKNQPEFVDPESLSEKYKQFSSGGDFLLSHDPKVFFDVERDVTFHFQKSLPFHPNGMCFEALNDKGETIKSDTYYSVGGGFVVSRADAEKDCIKREHKQLPYHFSSSRDLLDLSKSSGLSIAEMMLCNESVWRSQQETVDYLDRVWSVMQDCIERGCRTEGVLPGGLKIPRRAPKLMSQLEKADSSHLDTLQTLDWVNLYALAVNEENASGSRVVTAPTNGAAGIIPAVLKYYTEFSESASEEGVRDFLLTAAAIGILYIENASISGAEVGCQGEVGVACSMAAAGLTAVHGGTTQQIEQAAEIGMEHNLGLTCDPIGGLVQVPCIERNAMAAVKAINASRMALRGDGGHFVSLDDVIQTMKSTGADMSDHYKETSKGGLAVNVTEC